MKTTRQWSTVKHVTRFGAIIGLSEQRIWNQTYSGRQTKSSIYDTELRRTAHKNCWRDVVPCGIFVKDICNLCFLCRLQSKVATTAKCVMSVVWLSVWRSQKWSIIYWKNTNYKYFWLINFRYLLQGFASNMKMLFILKKKCHSLFNAYVWISTLPVVFANMNIRKYFTFTIFDETVPVTYEPAAVLITSQLCITIGYFDKVSMQGLNSILCSERQRIHVY